MQKEVPQLQVISHDHNGGMFAADLMIVCLWTYVQLDSNCNKL